MGRKASKRKAAATQATSPSANTSYCFLDIDGVLAPFGGRNPPPRPANEDCSEYFAPFDAACLRRLAQLVALSETTLVLSSSWRASPAAIDAIRERFRDFGPPLSEQSLELTTDLKRHEPRQWEIYRWLEAQRLTEAKWVALDDEDLVDGPENRQRRDVFLEHAVPVRSEIGFGDSDLDLALRILGCDRPGHA